jgi:hypothetical protein
MGRPPHREAARAVRWRCTASDGRAASAEPAASRPTVKSKRRRAAALREPVRGRHSSRLHATVVGNRGIGLFRPAARSAPAELGRSPPQVLTSRLYATVVGNRGIGLFRPALVPPPAELARSSPQVLISRLYATVIANRGIGLFRPAARFASRRTGPLVVAGVGEATRPPVPRSRSRSVRYRPFRLPLSRASTIRSKSSSE